MPYKDIFWSQKQDLFQQKKRNKKIKNRMLYIKLHNYNIVKQGTKLKKCI